MGFQPHGPAATFSSSISTEPILSIADPSASQTNHPDAANNSEGISNLLSARLPPNSYPEITPLHLAAANGDESLVQELISSGADVNALYENGPPVWGAIYHGHTSIVKMILSAGGTHVVPFRCAFPVENSLIGAIKSGKPEIVKLLIEYGVDVNEDQIQWGSAIGFVVTGPKSEDAGYEEKRIETARMLLDAGAEFDECDDYGGKPGTYAATYGHEGILKMLLDRGLHVEERYRPSYGEIEDEYRLLHLAVRGRHVETVRLLLGAGADPNSRTVLNLGSGFQKETLDGRTPMYFAAWRDWGEDQGFDRPKWTGMSREAEDSVAVTRMLIEHGGEINARALNGWTPLHAVAKNGDSVVATTRLLIESGADVNAKAMKSRTPLHAAVLGASIDSFGEDVLSDPRYLDREPKVETVEVVKLLLEKGADVDSRMDDGCTALDVARGKILAEVEKVLLGAGANSVCQKWNRSTRMESLQGEGEGEGEVD
jgi:ankyrin repeat protein